MKLDKNQLKRLVDAIYIYSGKNGYKKNKNTIYCVKENAFIHCDFLVVNSQKLIYRIYIKNYDYDDIFWEVMQMAENSKKNESFRAVNAFKAPSILLEKGEMDIKENFEEQAKKLVELVEKSSYDFLQQYDIDEYIISCSDGMYINILKYLAYIHMNKKAEADIVAQEALDIGEINNFENKGKSFFEWALMRY